MVLDHNSLARIQRKPSIRLILKDADLISFANLLNQSFGLTAGRSFFDDFPVWKMSGEYGVRRFGLFQDSNELVASVGARVARLKTENGMITIGIIGAVATHPRYRGNGFASILLKSALEWLEDQKAEFVALWGKPATLYTRFGFELGGAQKRVSLSKMNLPDINKLKTTVNDHGNLQIVRGWDEQLWKLLRKRDLGLLLRSKDKDWLEQHVSVHWYHTQNAYAAYGRGIDLLNIVHEWGGDPRELKMIFAQILSDFPEAQLIGAPELLSQIGLICEGAIEEHLAMIKVIGAEKKVSSALLNSVWLWGLDSA